MKTIRLDEVQLDLDSAINLAEQPLLLLTADGQEFFMTLADDFEQEVETLRQSQAFQRLPRRTISVPAQDPPGRDRG